MYREPAEVKSEEREREEEWERWEREQEARWAKLIAEDKRRKRIARFVLLLGAEVLMAILAIASCKTVEEGLVFELVVHIVIVALIGMVWAAGELI